MWFSCARRIARRRSRRLCHPAHNSSAIPTTITPNTNPFRFTFNILPVHLTRQFYQDETQNGPKRYSNSFHSSCAPRLDRFGRPSVRAPLLASTWFGPMPSKVTSSSVPLRPSEFVRIEAAALNELASRLDNAMLTPFTQATDLLLQFAEVPGGRIIVTGIGKSGII